MNESPRRSGHGGIHAPGSSLPTGSAQGKRRGDSHELNGKGAYGPAIPFSRLVIPAKCRDRENVLWLPALQQALDPLQVLVALEVDLDTAFPGIPLFHLHLGAEDVGEVLGHGLLPR